MFSKITQDCVHPHFTYTQLRSCFGQNPVSMFALYCTHQRQLFTSDQTHTNKRKISAEYHIRVPPSSWLTFTGPTDFFTATLPTSERLSLCFLDVNAPGLLSDFFLCVFFSFVKADWLHSFLIIVIRNKLWWLRNRKLCNKDYTIYLNSTSVLSQCFNRHFPRWPFCENRTESVFSIMCSLTCTKAYMWVKCRFIIFCFSEGIHTTTCGSEVR